jgi:hypothetical protein
VVYPKSSGGYDPFEAAKQTLARLYHPMWAYSKQQAERYILK